MEEKKELHELDNQLMIDTVESTNNNESSVTIEDDVTNSKSSLSYDYLNLKSALKTGKVALSLSIINIILFVGLLIYTLSVINKDDNSAIRNAISKSTSGVSIAYINSDSILLNYNLVKDMHAELEAKSKKYEAELKTKQAAFEKDASYFQQQVKKGSISEQSAQEIYGSLQVEQQKLLELQDKYTKDLARQEYELNILLIDTLNNLLKRYNVNNKFDFVFSYNKGSNILFTNDTLNITNQVLKLLNKEYVSKK